VADDPLPNLRYEHAVMLSTEMHRFVGHLAASEPGLWRHPAGTDLAPAVARHLYFHGLKAPVYETHRDLLLERPDRRLGLPDPILAALLRHLAERRGRRIAAPIDQAMAARLEAERDGRGPALDDARRGRPPELPPATADAPEILFFLPGRKFVRYLAPVFPRLGAPFAVSAALHPDAVREAHARGLPVTGPVEDPPPLPEHPRWPPFRALCRLRDRVDAELARHPSARLAVVLEGSHPSDEIVRAVAHERGLPCVCIQQGWSPIVTPGFQGMRHDAFLAWGEGFRELLAPHNPGLEVEIVGNHVLPRPETRVPIAERPRALAFFLQAPVNLITLEALERLFALIRTTATRHPDWAVYVREHPSGPLHEGQRARLGQPPNVRFRPAAEVPLDRLFGQVRASVAVYSTTILESLAADVVPIIANFTGMPHYSPPVAAEGAGVEVHAFDEAVAALDRVIEDPGWLATFGPAMARFRQRFFAQEGDPTGRIVDALERWAGR
jgi:hypothetical protein